MTSATTADSATNSAVERPTRDGAVVQFLRACSSAWLCMRRPAFLVPSFVALAIFAVMMVVGIFLSAARPGGSRVTDPPTYLSDLAGSGALSMLAGGIVSITGSCVLAIAAAHVASAFANGSVRIQLVRLPQRRTWLLGNLAVISILTVALTIAAVIAVIVSAYVSAASYNVSTFQWLTWGAYRQLGVTTINLAASMVGFAILGAALAVILRSAIATIGVGLCYALFEQLFAGVFGAGARFLPVANLSALSQGGTDHIGYGWAVIASCVVVGLAVYIAAEVIRRRDVLD